VDRDELQPAPIERVGLEGSLALRVELADGRIARVAIDGRRPVQAARVLEGRPAESALATLPFLYRLCGTAQSVAGLRAVEAAFDCGPGPAGCAARSLLVALEALEQSLWRILLDWPRCLGDRPDERALKRFRVQLAALRSGVFCDSHWRRLGGAAVNGSTGALAEAVESLGRDVDALVFGGARGDAALQSRGDFEQWVRDGRSPTGAVFEWVASQRLGGFGGAGVEPANGFDDGYLADRLAHDDAWEFCGLPDHHGEVRQTGALARLSSTPLVQELHSEYGFGLATQLGARLLEVTALLADIREQIPALAPEPTPALPAIHTGRALASVDTARGRLFHWVDVRDGRIARYRTLAPTEWNFHPCGPLARGLAGEPAQDAALTRRAVDLLVTAVDPCVGTRLAIAEA
jgi:hypothetical protein